MSEAPLLQMQEIASTKFDLNNISLDFIAKFIYNSISFDNNSITLEEVNKIIKNHTENIDEKKVLAVTNHKDAFLFVVNLVETNQVFDENALKDLHEILMRDICIGGLYRNVDISINGSNHTPPSHIKVYDRMKKYFDTIANHKGDELELVAYSHLQLAKIHPFLDGNGRLARLVLNYFLLKNHLLPVIILHTDKVRYHNYLEEYKVNKNIQPFIGYIKELEYKALGI